MLSTTIARNFYRNPTIEIDATKVKVRSSMHWPALESRFGDDSDGNDEECGIATDQRIIGGEIAALDDFPWTALLIYNSSELRVNYQLIIFLWTINCNRVLQTGFKYGCSGAIINRRYILTAAHCVTGKSVAKKGKL